MKSYVQYNKSPSKALMRELFPDPTSPKIQTNYPFLIFKLMSLTTKISSTFFKSLLAKVGLYSFPNIFSSISYSLDLFACLPPFPCFASLPPLAPLVSFVASYSSVFFFPFPYPPYLPLPAYITFENSSMNLRSIFERTPQ